MARGKAAALSRDQTMIRVDSGVEQGSGSCCGRLRSPPCVQCIILCLSQAINLFPPIVARTRLAAQPAFIVAPT